MRLLVAGNFTNRKDLYNELTEFHNNYVEIEEIIGSVAFPAMSTVLSWAEENQVKTCVYLQNDDSDDETILTNSIMANQENPDVVIIFDGKTNIKESLIKEANSNPKIQIVMVKE